MEKLTLNKFYKIIVIILAIIILVETICLMYKINIDMLFYIFWIIVAFEIGVVARPKIIKEEE